MAHDNPSLGYLGQPQLILATTTALVLSPITAQSADWTGFSIGDGFSSFTGTGTNWLFDSDFDEEFDIETGDPQNTQIIEGVKSEGYGLSIGYDHDFGQFVVGIGAAIGIAGKDQTTFLDEGFWEVATPTGSKAVRLRLGWKAGERSLFYGFGGYGSSTASSLSYYDDGVDVSEIGSTEYETTANSVGVGIEYMFTENFSGVFEVSRVTGTQTYVADYGVHPYSGPGSVDLSGTAVTIGANYRF